MFVLFTKPIVNVIYVIERQESLQCCHGVPSSGPVSQRFGVLELRAIKP